MIDVEARKNRVNKLLIHYWENIANLTDNEIDSIINEITELSIDPEAFDMTHEWSFKDISEIDPVVDALFDEKKIVSIWEYQT